MWKYLKQSLRLAVIHFSVFRPLLKTQIFQVFKKPLEDPNQVGGSLLDPTEVKIIFGNLPPIHEIHFDLLVQLKNAALNWREDISVGALILKHVSQSLPPTRLD